MDIERLIKEWQNQKLEGSLFDKPIDVITEDVRKRAQKRARKYRLILFAGIGLAVVIAAAAIVTIYWEHSLLFQVATLILMTINFCELLWMLKWRATEHAKPYHLPAKQFLIRERDLMEKKLRQIRWQYPWSGIAGLGGLVFIVLAFLVNLTTGEEILDFLIAFSLPLLIIHFTALRDMKAELTIFLERINREIRQFEEISNSSD
jgi:hypothetical protein